MPKEIWFKCFECGKEGYCDIYFEKIPEAELICPFCINRMKLKELRMSVKEGQGKAKVLDLLMTFCVTQVM